METSYPDFIVEANRLADSVSTAFHVVLFKALSPENMQRCRHPILNNRDRMRQPLTDDLTCSYKKLELPILKTG